MNAQSITARLKKYPVLASCGAVFLVLLVVLYFRSDLISEQQEQLETLSKQNAKQLANIAAGARLDEQLAYLIEANKAVRARALPLGGLAQNLQYFYKIESELGIKYSDVRPLSRPTASKDATYVPLPYTLTLDADFTKVITLLRRLERGEFFCRINTLNINRSANGAILSVNLDLLGNP